MTTLLTNTRPRGNSPSTTPQPVAPVRQPRQPRQTQPHHQWSKAAVAELSNAALTGLSRDELIAVIGAGLQTLPNPRAAVSLECRSLETLRRLAFLSRRSCRNQGY